jgi:Mor family transcriptional regulator
MRHLRKALAGCLVANGIEPDKGRALEMAEDTLYLLIAFEIITPKKLEEYERDAQIYYLRSHGVDMDQIRACYDVSRQWVHECLKRHIKRLRAAMRGEK